MNLSEFIVIELSIVVAIFGILVAGFSHNFAKLFITINPKYSEGARTGVVYKLSHKGMIWKTWEGEMHVGAMSSNGQGMAIPVAWAFSVVDPPVIEKLQRASEKGVRVTVEYNEARLRCIREGESEYLAVGVKE